MDFYYFSFCSPMANKRDSCDGYFYKSVTASDSYSCSKKRIAKPFVTAVTAVTVFPLYTPFDYVILIACQATRTKSP